MEEYEKLMDSYEDVKKMDVDEVLKKRQEEQDKQPEPEPEPAQEEEQTEELTDNIWHRLGESWRLHARLGEETLTDLLILDFLPSALRYSEVFS